MDHKRYIAHRRARFDSISGQVNIPYGAVLEVRDGFLYWQGKQLCTTTCQNAFDFFSQDDDGQGRERGALVTAILTRLRPKNKQNNCQARWDKVWENSLCQRYRRPEHEDHWIWSYDFFNAPVCDLQHIAALIGAR